MFTSIFGLVAFFATLNERLIELIYKPIAEQLPANPVVLMATPYLAMITGVGLALSFQLDIISPLVTVLSIDLISPWPGIVITGLIIGSGSNFLHDIWPETE